MLLLAVAVAVAGDIDLSRLADCIAYHWIMSPDRSASNSAGAVASNVAGLVASHRLIE
jgi:hypothetical protein